jgi:hypothetical protein
MKRAIVAVMAALLTFVGASAADTPDEAALRERLTNFVTQAPGFKLPPTAAKLDAAYDRADWRAFKAALDETYAGIKTINDQMLLMNWELLRLYNGGGYVIAKLYAVDSMNVALTYEKGGLSQGAAMKVRAFANTLYVVALIASDSPMCKDMSAPYDRMVEYQNLARDIIRWGKTLSPDDKKRTIELALRQERMVAPLRKKDEALCRGGNDESMALLAKTKVKDWENAKDGPPDPLRYGKTKIVEVEGEFHPQYKPDAEWKKTREEVRPTLQQQLEKLLEPAK